MSVSIINFTTPAAGRAVATGVAVARGVAVGEGVAVARGVAVGIGVASGICVPSSGSAGAGTGVGNVSESAPESKDACEVDELITLGSKAGAQLERQASNKSGFSCVMTFRNCKGTPGFTIRGTTLLAYRASQNETYMGKHSQSQFETFTIGED